MYFLNFYSVFLDLSIFPSLFALIFVAFYCSLSGVLGHNVNYWRYFLVDFSTCLVPTEVVMAKKTKVFNYDIVYERGCSSDILKRTPKRYQNLD